MIQIDLENDLKAILKDFLEEKSNEPITEKNLENLLLKYYNVIEKMISRKPREVFISRELQKKLDETDDSSFLYIMKKFENGEDLNPHLSKKIFNPNFNDSLLFHWGITHLHLTKSKNSSEYFYDRGGHLLAKVTDSEVYFIDAKDHLKGSEYSDINFMEIILDNWPHLLEKSNDIKADKLTKKERHTLRKKSINVTFYDIKGDSYRLKDTTGVVATGQKIDHIRKTDMFLCRDFKNGIDEIYKELLTSYKKSHFPINVRFIKDRFCYETKCLHLKVVDLNSNKILATFTLN